MGKLVLRVDDFDLDAGMEHPAEAEETLAFVFDGVAYAGDFTAERAAEFRRVMEPYCRVSTKIGAQRVNVPHGVIVPKRVAARVAESKDNAEPYDEWYVSRPGDTYKEDKRKRKYRQAAREFGRTVLGLNIGDYGRVPRDVFVAYAAHLAAQKDQGKGESQGQSGGGDVAEVG